MWWWKNGPSCDDRVVFLRRSLAKAPGLGCAGSCWAAGSGAEEGWPAHPDAASHAASCSGRRGVCPAASVLLCGRGRFTAVLKNRPGLDGPLRFGSSFLYFACRRRCDGGGRYFSFTPRRRVCAARCRQCRLRLRLLGASVNWVPKV